MKKVEDLANQYNLTIYRNLKSDKDQVYFIDLDSEIMKFSIIETDKLNDSFGIVGIGELKIENYNHEDFEEITSFEDLKFVISPNYIYIIQYYLIGGKSLKLEGENIELFISSFIKKRLPNKNLNLELQNYHEWIQSWNKLKDYIIEKDLDFEDFLKFSIFDQIMKNGTNIKFSKLSCFGYKLSNKIYSDTCHIIYSLENKDDELVSIGVKIITRRNGTLQNFDFYNSTYPTQPFTHISDPTKVDKIISNKLDFYNIVEIDQNAGIINLHVER